MEKFAWCEAVATWRTNVTTSSAWSGPGRMTCSPPTVPALRTSATRPTVSWPKTVLCSVWPWRWRFVSALPAICHNFKLSKLQQTGSFICLIVVFTFRRFKRQTIKRQTKKLLNFLMKLFSYHYSHCLLLKSIVFASRYKNAVIKPFICGIWTVRTNYSYLRHWHVTLQNAN